MAVGGPIKEFQLQCPGFTAKDFAIAAKLLPRYRHIVRWLRKLYMFTWTHRGLSHTGAVAGLREIRMRECYPDDTFRTCH